MRNLVFEIQEVIDETGSPDVWVIYKSEPDLDQSYSLGSLLWDIRFNPSKILKKYEVVHSTFYEMLLEDDGKVQLAKIVTTICELL